jgi:hypothetical protein
MEKKKVAQFIDRGCGFPVIIENVFLIKARGRWIPHIDYNAFEKAVLYSLAQREGRLTGNQVRFIRLSLEKTLEEFALRFGVSHPAVLKWEKTGNKVTAMNWTTEKDIRLCLIKSLEASQRDFFKLYELLETIRVQKPIQVTLGANKLAA